MLIYDLCIPTSRLGMTQVFVLNTFSDFSQGHRSDKGRWLFQMARMDQIYLQKAIKPASIMVSSLLIQRGRNPAD